MVIDRKLFVLLALVLIAAGPRPASAGPKADSPRAAAAIQATLTPETRFQVFEGLPHPGAESELAASELKRDDIVRYDDHPFYGPALRGDPTGNIPDALRRPGALERWSGEKKCGGFHPDYAIAWTTRGKDYRALICFTCGEVILTGGVRPLRYDLRKETETLLRGLLRDYRRKRPGGGGRDGGR